MNNIEIIKKQNELIKKLFKMVTEPTIEIAKQVSTVHDEANTVIEASSDDKKADVVDSTKKERKSSDKAEKVEKKPKEDLPPISEPKKEKKRMF